MIGYYAHHQGRGHATRATTIARHLRRPVTGLSTLPEPAGWPGDWVRLPDDRAAEPEVPTASGVLHWAPLGHAGLRARMALIAAWVERARPSVLVCDVSAEIALFARLMGVPVVVVAMRGDRTDRAHTNAYDAASVLLAPWVPALHEPGWPSAWTDKTVFTGAFSRFDDLARPAVMPDRRHVLVLWGGGGTDIGPAELRAARAATPGWRWTLRTPSTPSPDLWTELARASVVVTHGGENAVAEVAAARRPTVVVAQRRPHDEQRATVAALARADLCATAEAWPEPRAWPGLLAGAMARGGDGWARWNPGDGARVAARVLDVWVERDEGDAG